MFSCVCGQAYGRSAMQIVSRLELSIKRAGFKPLVRFSTKAYFGAAHLRTVLPSVEIHRVLSRASPRASPPDLCSM